MKSVLKDLTGKKFGMLTVLSRAPTRVTPNGTKQTYWWVQCDCGKELECSSPNLKRTRQGPVSCGCVQRQAREKKIAQGIWRSDSANLLGKRYGTRIVTDCVGVYKSGQKKWLYKCDCGQTGTSISRAIINSKSCGCLNPKTRHKKPKYDWVDYKERIAHVRSARQKCKKKSPDYDLTDQQIHDFMFGSCAYCGVEGTTERRLGIDRVDSSAGYIKENCVSSCWTCNKIKSTMTIQELTTHLKKMLPKLGELNGIKIF